MFNLKTGIGTIVACVLLSAASAMATPISGSFLGVGYATVSFQNLNFCPNGQTPDGANQGTACGPGTGNITIAGGSQSFTSAGGNLNTIMSLSQGSEPVGVTVNVPNWLVFIPAVGAPPITLTLTEVLPGSFTSSPANCPAGAPMAGQICTPPGSAFDLINQTASSSSATFQINGNAEDGNPADLSPFVAIFTSQFSVPYQSLLAALSINNGTGNYSSSYSLTVTATAVPEPVTFSIVGAGLLGLGLLRRRWTKK